MIAFPNRLPTQEYSCAVASSYWVKQSSNSQESRGLKPACIYNPKSCTLHCHNNNSVFLRIQLCRYPAGQTITILIHNQRDLSHSPGWLCSQARPLNAIRARCSRVCSRWARQQIALPAPTQRHYWLMPHWVWPRHQRLPENIKVFSTPQTACYRPFRATEKENGEGF